MFEIFPGYNSTPMTELAMQMPMLYFAAPHTPDWNGDGTLDLWHHNHYTFSSGQTRWSDPSITRRGPKKPGGGCMIDWDAVLRNRATGQYVAPNGGAGFIEWTDTNADSCFDVHSSAYLDIDNDGLKDLFLITGGGQARGNSSAYDNLLFWGEYADTDLGFKLIGGRDAAQKAGLNGRTSQGNDRGRHHQWFDADGDGRLDVIFLNDEREDHTFVPGNLLHNRGSREFSRTSGENGGFAEFSILALQTDLDGDGFARELIVPSNCEGRSDASSKSKFPPNEVCNRSPLGTLNVYTLHSSKLLVRESASPPLRQNLRYISAGTGDFDGDGLPDVALLYGSRVDFYLSRRRQTTCSKLQSLQQRRQCLLDLSEPNKRMKLSVCEGGTANSMRFADFNLDGKEDMLLICKKPGRHVILELKSDGDWEEMQTLSGKQLKFGELQSKTSMLGGPDFCKGVPKRTLVKGKDKCLQYLTRGECDKLRYTKQFLLCNMRNTAPENNPAVALGATVSDFDNDGYPDIMLGHRFGGHVMLRNTISNNPGIRRFIVVRLDRTAGEAAAIGAVVKVTATRMGTGGNQTTTQVRVISSLSHVETAANGSAEHRLIFGLGSKGLVRKISVRWPHCCNDDHFNVKLKQAQNLYNRLIEFKAPTTCDTSCLER